MGLFSRDKFLPRSSDAPPLDLAGHEIFSIIIGLVLLTAIIFVFLVGFGTKSVSGCNKPEPTSRSAQFALAKIIPEALSFPASQNYKVTGVSHVD